MEETVKTFGKSEHHNSVMERMKKQVKITKHQKKVLLDFLEKNFEYVRGAFKTLPSSESEDKNMMWEDITTRLNGIGPQKTSYMWRKTCADLRMQIKKKVIEGKELTDEDKRLAKFYALQSDPMDKTSRLVNDRVTAIQKTKMIDLMRDNYWFNQNTVKLEPNTTNALDWDEIGEQLNQAGGCVKNTIAWRKCWSDIKCDVGKKFSNGAVPKMLTEDEYKIAQLYGWLNGAEIATTNNAIENIEQTQVIATTEPASPVRYVIDPTVIIKTERSVSQETPQDHVMETEEFVVEQLDEEEPDVEEQSVDDVLTSTVEVEEMEDTVFMSHVSTQTKTEPTESEPMINSQNTLLEQILAAQLRTNTLLEQLLEKSSDNKDIQTGILDELKNNSFMMVNRAFSK